MLQCFFVTDSGKKKVGRRVCPACGSKVFVLVFCLFNAPNGKHPAIFHEESSKNKEAKEEHN